VFRVPCLFHIALLALLLATCCLGSSAQLETRRSTRLSAETWAVAVGDFNKDGFLDAAVITVFGTNNLAILMGNGDGTFKQPIYYTVGDVAANSVVAADFRHNGNLDLVLGESLTENVYVLLGHGDGTFDQAVAYPTLGRPFVAGVGDFNRDGKLDIWTLSDGSAECGCVEILLGTGDGTFGTAILTPTASTAFAAAAGDFDHDGNLDLVASETFGGSQIEILLGKGDGSFRHGKKYLTPSPPQSIAVGHFVAGNKNLDLALAEPEGGAVVILLGRGGGTFGQGQIIPELFPSSITTGDFNDDGITDLLTVTGFNSNFVTTYLSNGDGTFQPGASFPAGNESLYPASGDFNGDHQTDVIVPDNLGHSVITLLNTGAVTFAPTTPLNFGQQATGTTSAPKRVTLTNTGTAPLTMSALTVKGQFSLSSTTCSAQVAPGAVCSISITFTPQTKGSKSGLVSIGDSASSKPQVIELSGTGT
jgi:hypothetical protein